MWSRRMRPKDHTGQRPWYLNRWNLFGFNLPPKIVSIYAITSGISSEQLFFSCFKKEYMYFLEWMTQGWGSQLQKHKVSMSPYIRKLDTHQHYFWRPNQSILKEISPEYSLEGLMLKLMLQYFGHLMRRANSLENTLMLEKTEGRRRRGRQDEMVGWHHQTQWTWVCTNSGIWWRTGRSCCAVVHGVTKTEQLNSRVISEI